MLPRALMLTIKNAGEGKGQGAEGTNIQHPTSNIQLPIEGRKHRTPNAERRMLKEVSPCTLRLLSPALSWFGEEREKLCFARGHSRAGDLIQFLMGGTNIEHPTSNIRHPMGGGKHRTPNAERRMLKGVAMAVGVMLALVGTGCKPPGPRALLEGQSLVEHGRYAEAIERLKTATTLLSTNANAWNYLGLAYHQSGQANDAAEAYKKALAYDQNLVEVHYNLGCLWLEQNRPDLAKAELTAYTLHREKSAEGFTKLGEAQFELHDLTGAEKSLNQARLIDGQDPVALNDMGVVQVQRNRVTEAGQFFNAALRTKPDYAPAILNMAILYQTHLNNRQYALQRYHDYLALTPKPANWEAVNAVARALEEEVNGAPTGRAVAPTPTPPAANPAPATPPRTVATTPRLAKPEPANTRSSSTQPTEVTTVPPEPVIRGVPNTGNATEPAASSSTAAGQADHRGFFSRVFHGSKTNPPGAGGSPQTLPVAPTPEPKPISYPRYAYHSIAKPSNGDRTAATQASADGWRAQQAKQLSEAATAYRKAIQLDPSYFDAYFNLGAVSVQSGNVAVGLAAYETALAIEPDSAAARFNFAVALSKANYPIDAAGEFEKMLAKSPTDANAVWAHFAAGNLYANQLRQPARAREHYQKVLELNPNFPQAGMIRSWLGANP
jgi:tetratricopeptide (TPR) repeat protein